MEGGEPGESKISLTPEYQIVFSHFMDDLTQDYATARVNKVSRIRKERELKHIRETDHLLGEGILCEVIENFQNSSMGYPDVLNAMELLQDYMMAGFEDFDTGPLQLTDAKIMPIREGKPLYVSQMMPELIEYYGEKLDAVSNLLRAENTEFVRAFAKRTRNAVVDGEIDVFFGFDRGTYMRLFESWFRTHNCLPESYYNYVARCVRYQKMIATMTNDENDGKRVPKRVRRRKREKIKRKMDRKREVEEKISQEQAMLKKRYGFHLDRRGASTRGGLLFCGIFHDSLRMYATNPDLMRLGTMPFSRAVSRYNPDRVPTPRQFIEDNQDNEELIHWAKHTLNPGVYLWTRETASRELDRFGLADIVDLRWQDFIWEDL